jgi:hypothetical protein
MKIYDKGHDPNYNKFAPHWFVDAEGNIWCYADKHEMILHRAKERNPRDPFTVRDYMADVRPDDRSSQLNLRDDVK